MKIVFNTLPLHTQSLHRGIGVYTRLLVKSLQTYDPGNTYKVAQNTRDLDTADIIHYPYFDFFFLTLPFIKKKPTVVTIHDVIPLLYPNHYKKGIKGSLKFALQHLSLGMGVNKIVTDSDASKSDIIKHLHIKPHQISRVYLAPDDGYHPSSPQQIQQVLEKYHLNAPYFLYVGDINYNKNVPGLIKAFSTLDSPHALVLVTKALKNDIPETRALKHLIANSPKRDRIIPLTTLSSQTIDDLKDLYSGADWYIQPSFYEGFGLPVLEAMKCGTPVISSSGGSLKEITADAALTFDPFKPKALTNAIHKAISLSADKRQNIINRGFENCTHYSWQKTALQMKKIYEALVS
jgi:glycosyltransferase involved in cell wall biosynthesis